MSPTVQPYLFFDGRCEEALAHYEAVLGAEVDFLMRYGESPEPLPGNVPPDYGDKILHATFRIGASTLLAADDCGAGADWKPHGVSLSLTLPSERDVDRTFAALADGGVAILAPAKTFWSPRFAMLRDRFGVGWMLSAAADPNPGSAA